MDVLLSSEASKAQGWIVEGGDDEDVESDLGSGLTSEVVGEASGADSASQPRRSVRNVRELHEEDFVSDNEETDGEEDVVYDFESDGERVLEGYGEEEVEG